MPDKKDNTTINPVRRVLLNEISMLVYVIIIVFSFIMFVIMPNKDLKTDFRLMNQEINNIRDNHLVHVQDGIDKNTKLAEGNKEVITEINIKVEKILTAIENK